MATLSIDPRVSSRAADFVRSNHRMLIDGAFVGALSGKTFPVYNPATGEVIAYVPEAEAEDVNRAVMAARRAFDEGPWPRMSPSERGRMLWKIGDSWRSTWRSWQSLSLLTTANHFPWPAWQMCR